MDYSLLIGIEKLTQRNKDLLLSNVFANQTEQIEQTIFQSKDFLSPINRANTNKCEFKRHVTVDLDKLVSLPTFGLRNKSEKAMDETSRNHCFMGKTTTTLKDVNFLMAS